MDHKRVIFRRARVLETHSSGSCRTNPLCSLRDKLFIMVNMRLQYIVFAVMVLTHHAYVHAGKKVYRITDKVFSCSSFLSMIISEFCNSTYKIVKRDTSTMLVKLSKSNYKTNKRWLAEERWRRVRRQIANECCEQPCTIREMIKYCPDNARLLQEQPEIFY